MEKLTKNKKIRTAIILIVCSFLLALVCAFFLRKERNGLMTMGEETVGMVTRTYIAGSRDADCFNINFSFFKGDTILDGVCSFYLGEREQFDKAVVGGTYRVRYIPDKPNKEARIYIDEPVSVSEGEYDKLLERWGVMREKVEKSKTWWKNF